SSLTERRISALVDRRRKLRSLVFSVCAIRRFFLEFALSHWVPPAAGRLDRLSLGGPPCPRQGFVQRSAGPEHGIDNSPGLLDIILTCKECRIPRHRVGEHSFVSIHLIGSRVPAGEHFR